MLLRKCTNYFSTVTYRGFILCDVSPRNGSTTNIVAKSSNSARSRKFIATVPVF